MRKCLSNGPACLDVFQQYGQVVASVKLDMMRDIVFIEGSRSHGQRVHLLQLIVHALIFTRGETYSSKLLLSGPMVPSLQPIEGLKS